MLRVTQSFHNIRSASNTNAVRGRDRRDSCVSSTYMEQSFATSSEYFAILEEDFPIDLTTIKQFYRETKGRLCACIEEGSPFDV